MALKINVEDRVSTYPGRVKLTPVSGEQNVYDMTRADLPLNPGTPVNKVLFDSKADRLTADATVYVSQTGNDVTGTGEFEAPFKTIQAAIDAIPKNLNGYTATVEIPGGDWNERIVCKGFVGGKLSVGSGTQVWVQGIEVDSCSYVELWIPYITHGDKSVGPALLNVTNGSVVSVPEKLTIWGDNDSGVQASYGSTVCFGYGYELVVNECSTAAVVATSGSKVCLSKVTGVNNTFGLTATMGGTITYGENDLTSDFGDNEQDGGRIFTNS